MTRQAIAAATAMELVMRAKAASDVGGVFAACGITKPGMGPLTMEVLEETWAEVGARFMGTDNPAPPLAITMYEDVDDRGTKGDFIACVSVPLRTWFK